MNTKLLAGLLLSSTMLVSVSAFAADDEAGSKPQDAKSEANVTIEPGNDTDPNNPIDPIDPENPGDENETGNTGPLAIDVVSNLNFGTLEIKSGETIQKVVNEKDPRVQVTDKRGNGVGWTLQVMMSKEFTAGKNVLKGSAITLPAGTLETNNVNQDNAPVAKEVVINEEAQTLMLAEKENGLGSWADMMAKDATTLTIPGGNYAGEYQAEITWSLLDAPQA